MSRYQSYFIHHCIFVGKIPPRIFWLASWLKIFFNSGFNCHETLLIITLMKKLSKFPPGPYYRQSGTGSWRFYLSISRDIWNPRRPSQLLLRQCFQGVVSGKRKQSCLDYWSRFLQLISDSKKPSLIFHSCYGTSGSYRISSMNSDAINSIFYAIPLARPQCDRRLTESRA